MTKISRFKLNPKELNFLLNDLWQDLADIDEAEKVYTFLKPFFSPTEGIMFAKRLEILKRLRQEESYDLIMGDLKVTPNTVSKMNNLLHLANNKFLEILDELITLKNKRMEKLRKKPFHPSKMFHPIR